MAENKPKEVQDNVNKFPMSWVHAGEFMLKYFDQALKYVFFLIFIIHKPNTCLYF